MLTLVATSSGSCVPTAVTISAAKLQNILNPTKDFSIFIKAFLNIYPHQMEIERPTFTHRGSEGPYM